MRISDDVLCLYSGEVKHRGGSYVIEVPDREVTVGAIDEGTVCRVALVDGWSDEEKGRINEAQIQDDPAPPVDVGDHRTIDIEDTGEQGDGIARIERGYGVIVPDTELGERVTVEITDVRENQGFGKVLNVMTITNSRFVEFICGQLWRWVLLYSGDQRPTFHWRLYYISSVCSPQPRGSHR